MGHGVNTITVDGDRFGLSRDLLAHALKAEGIDTRKYFQNFRCIVHVICQWTNLIERRSIHSSSSFTEECMEVL